MTKKMDAKFKFSKVQTSICLKLIVAICMLLPPGVATAQRMTASTNLLNYLNFGTINGEFGLALNQHLSLSIQVKYNPFIYIYNSGESQFQNKQLTAAGGLRYWPWHVWSGWFVSGTVGGTEFNRGGIISQETYEGSAVGVTLGGGYALMLNPHLNMDFGVGVMGGYADYVRYRCPKCGPVEMRQKRLFIAPNNILVQLSYLF